MHTVLSVSEETSSLLVLLMNSMLLTSGSIRSWWERGN